MILDMLTENIQRENIQFSVLRKAIRPLIEAFGLEELAKKLGKSLQWFHNIQVINRKVAPDIQKQVYSTPKRGSLPEGGITQRTAVALGQQFPVDQHTSGEVRKEHAQKQAELVDAITKDKLPTPLAEKVIKKSKTQPEKPVKQIVKEVKDEQSMAKSLIKDLEGKQKIDQFYVMYLAPGLITLFDSADGQMRGVELRADRFFCQIHKQIGCLCISTLRNAIRKGAIDLKSYILPAPEPPQKAPEPKKPDIPKEEPQPEIQPQADIETVETTEPEGGSELEVELLKEIERETEEKNQEVEEHIPTLPVDDLLPEEPIETAPEPLSTLEKKAKLPRQTTLTEFSIKIRIEEDYITKMDHYQKVKNLKTRDETVTSIIKDYFDLEAA